MEWGPSVQRLINHTLERSWQFQERLEELKSVPYLSKAPPRFLELVGGLLLSIRETLIDYNRIFSETTENEVHEALFHRIQSLSSVLAEFYFLLSSVEFSRTIRNPASISLPMESLANQVAPDSLVIIYPSYVCNYSYFNVVEHLRDRRYSQFFSPQLLDKYPKYFAVITFPDILKNNILSHANIGHELGHLFIDYKDITSEALEEIHEFKLEISRRDLERFFEEYVADIVSVCLFGPASFFALAEFGGSVIRFEQPTYTHPPLVFRFKNIVDTLREYGHEDFFKKNKNTSPAARKLHSALELWKNSAEELCQKTYKLTKAGNIFTALQVSLEKARQLVGQKVHSDHQLQLQDNIFDCVNLIEEGIPPSSYLNQQGLMKNSCEQVKLGTILNAAWLYRVWKFEKKRKFGSADEVREYMENLSHLSRLTQKAVEQSETIARYRKAKKTDKKKEEGGDS
ncbi:hypothetical protein ES702_05704 [subsurface metagenome]